MPLTRITQNGDHGAPRRQLGGRDHGGGHIHRTAAPGKYALVLDEPPRHAARLLVRDPHGVVDELPAGLEVGRDARDADPFDDGVDLLAAAGALAFGRGVHDAVLDLVVQSGPLGVG